jgi:hypothetical protein
VIALLALLAVPADARLSLHAGASVIEKVQAGVLLVETEGPLRAEMLPSGNEVLLEPRAKGIARVFFFARHEVRVIEVAIDTQFPEPGPAPSCPVVKDAACYAQWRAHVPPDRKLIFELEGLQAEARAAQEELARAGLEHIEVRLSAFGVKLKGARDEAEKRKALRAIYPAILGRLRLDS